MQVRLYQASEPELNQFYLTDDCLFNLALFLTGMMALSFSSLRLFVIFLRLVSTVLLFFCFSDISSFFSAYSFKILSL